MSISTWLFRQVRYELGLALAAAAVVVLAGCSSFPEPAIRWSPNGERGLVVSGDCFAIVDAEGKVTRQTTLPDTVGEFLQSTAWMPDSDQVVRVRWVAANDWKEYAGLLGPERAASVVADAEDLIPLIRKYRGDWVQWRHGDRVNRWETDHPKTELDAALFYLKEMRPKLLEPVLQAMTDKKEGQNEKTDHPGLVPIFELTIASVASDETKDGRVLFRTPDPITWFGAAPTGKMVALVIKEEGVDSPELKVIAVKDGKSLVVDRGATEAAWTPDGSSLVYAKTEIWPSDYQGQFRTGTVTRRRLCDETGLRLAELPEPQDVGVILYGDRVNQAAVLPDGRTLVACPQAHFPGLPKDVPSKLSLFLIRPGDPGKIERVVPEAVEGDLPERVDCFVVNPDGTRVAIPGENGELAVVSLITCEVTSIQGKVANFDEKENPSNKARLTFTLPSWRTPDEVCYAVPAGAPDGSAKRAEVVVQKIGEPRHAISKEWPDALLSSLTPTDKSSP